MISHAAPAERATAGYRIRPLALDDRARVIELVRLSLGEGTIPREAAYWAWKHEQNPFGVSPGLVAESETDELIGLRMFMRWQWRLRGQRVSTVRAVDTATHPQWQGRGIFSRLTLALLERLQAEAAALVFNTPNEKSRPGYLKMGWSSLGRTSLWVRPVRPLRMLRSRLSSRAAPPVREEPDGTTRFRSAAELVAHPALPDLLARCRWPEQRLTTDRSADYVRWRYADVPGFDYQAVWQLDAGGAAAVVFRVKTAGMLRELRICDVFVAPDAASRRAARELLQGLLAETGRDYAVAMDTGSSAVTWTLAQAGFLPALRSGPILTVRSLAGTEGMADPLRRGAWGFAIGDLELF